MKQRCSCSGCLEQIMQIEPSKHSKAWEKLGRQLPQCDLCKAALKDKMHGNSRSIPKVDLN